MNRGPSVGPLFYNVVIKWKHFPRYWPFVRRIHRSPVNSPHKGQWRGALMFSLICVWINGWVNNREAGDLRRYRAHHDVTVMLLQSQESYFEQMNNFLSIVFLHQCGIARESWHPKSPGITLFNKFWGHLQIKYIKAPHDWWGNLSVSVGFPSQRASDTESVSKSWYHRGMLDMICKWYTWHEIISDTNVLSNGWCWCW